MPFQPPMNEILHLIREAGQQVQSVYEHPEASLMVDYKADNSPLTQADRLAHQTLVEGLAKQIGSGFPILSEEGELPFYQERSKWPTYWLIDPLDGTKEFVHRTGDFTVNVALIEGNTPIWGAIYAPALQMLYWGGKGFGAFKQKGQAQPESIQVQIPFQQPVRAVRSRRHGHEKEHQQAKTEASPLNSLIFQSIGSSLKFCLVAEGQADIYARIGPTSEWDTAAGQAILEAAGGIMVDLQGQTVRYNIRESVVQPAFIALGDKALLPEALQHFDVNK